MNSYGLVGGELMEKVLWILRPDLWSDDPGRLLLLRVRTRDGEAGGRAGAEPATREMNEVPGSWTESVLRGVEGGLPWS